MKLLESLNTPVTRGRYAQVGFSLMLVKYAIDILVNNAGLAVGRGPLDTGLSEDWNRMLDTNIKGLLYMSHAVIPLLKKHPFSHLINFFVKLSKGYP